MGINSYQREIYANQLEHGAKGSTWGNHKYIRKEGNRYIYPEDIEGGHHRHHINPDAVNFGTGFGDGMDRSRALNNGSIRYGNNAKMKMKSAIASKDMSKVNDARKDLAIANYLHRASRSVTENGEGITKRERDTDNRIVNAANKQINIDNGRYVSKMIESQKRDEERDRKIKKEKSEHRKKLSEQQRKSAHAGYEEDRKNFPDGGSTEELERQKRKTKARKSASKRRSYGGPVSRHAPENPKTESSKSYLREIRQIGSAHQAATRLYDNNSSLENRSYTDTSGSIERQKRKTALRKRHKK